MQIVNLSFIHNGTYWIARDEQLEVAGKDLAELDQNLRVELKAKLGLKQGSRIRVNLDFDYSTIPHWITQYHPYYMHRSLEFEF